MAAVIAAGVAAETEGPQGGTAQTMADIHQRDDWAFESVHYPQVEWKPDSRHNELLKHTTSVTVHCYLPSYIKGLAITPNMACWPPMGHSAEERCHMTFQANLETIVRIVSRFTGLLA